MNECFVDMDYRPDGGGADSSGVQCQPCQYLISTRGDCMHVRIYVFVVVISMPSTRNRQKMRKDRKKQLEKQDRCHSQAELSTRKPVSD